MNLDKLIADLEALSLKLGEFYAILGKLPEDPEDQRRALVRARESFAYNDLNVRVDALIADARAAQAGG